jgi:hypothetical protein
LSTKDTKGHEEQNGGSREEIDPQIAQISQIGGEGKRVFRERLLAAVFGFIYENLCNLWMTSLFSRPRKIVSR